ncbi:sensor histidine kinase [Paenibacillus sp. H1-7]|uniref:sensor histidine kinase n=1 Tax=Paenibacillus sp. H1-7 TaxID=2282849 RepID=UPI001EF8E310|nr:histidine kinase [Paenibacillus sp. H1-7]ULL16700.1 sensor histidine kinase [Paenibacillus sp. H1-7]
MSFRMKLNGLFLGLTLAFMAISSFISYFVSQKLIIDNIKLSNESELSINLETMENSINKSKEKFQLFMDDFQFHFDSVDVKDSNFILRKAFDFNSELRTFLYSNREFKGIFLYQNQVLIGTSLANEVISYTEDMDERAATQSLNEYIWTQLKEDWKYGQSDFFEENLIIAPIQEGAYLIAVLDFQKLLDQSDLQLNKLNAKHQVIYGDQQKTDDLLNHRFTEPDPGASVTFRLENQIVSVKNKDGNKYFLLRDISPVDHSINQIVWKLVGYGLIIFIVFAAISHFNTGMILRPVYDFIQKLKQVKGFEERESIHRYITTYREHSSAYKKLFLFFSMIIIPTLSMILISYYHFDQVIEENSRQANIQMFKQTAKRTENNLQSYHSYMSYLILNREFQELMMNVNGDSLQRSRDFSDTLIRKGVIDKSLSYISIYDAHNRLVFSNTKNKPAITPTQPLLVMKKEIKYLANTLDKSNLFKYMGYIEFGINSVLDNQRHAAGTSAVNLMNRKSDNDDVQMISSPMDHKYTEYIRKHGAEMIGDPIDHKYITVKGQKTLFSTIPIHDLEEWNLGLFVPASWEEQRYIFIILYLIEISCMLCIIIIASYLLGKRMTAPVRRAIHLMEGYPHDQSIRLRGTEHDFEFVVLAYNFNNMLSRLESLSIELMTKENENLEMEKRINKLLFKALQSQINPHFLQNIFTSIMLLLKTGKSEEASKMLVATAKFLKTSLSGSRDLITLEEELEHVQNYIQIQSIRFEHQLVFQVNVDEAYYKVFVPKLILQPIVENAIHHAMEKNRVLTIRISSEITENNNLIILIEDDGKGMDAVQLANAIHTMYNKAQSAHCGLSNVHERLTLEFGEGCGLEIRSAKGTGTHIKMKIRLPLRRLET